MEEIKNVKGTHDVIGDEANAYTAVESLLKSIAELFAYKEVRPPVLEHSELFVRGVGESSDVVRKEMYTFLDKGERSLTLRPEFTAGIMRVIVQNKLYVDREMPLKLYYCGPVFRYERPQLGRYRQFNQFGVESVGQPNYLNDAEVITMAYTMLTTLGLENVTLKINTLGDDQSRENYKTALKEFFKDKVANMCPDCQSRFELNPLRILDCKVPEDQEIVKNAPKMSAYLTEESKEKFQKLCDVLDDMAIPYEVDDTLVRGLDYYSDAVFEFHYKSSKGNNYGAIGAGGHYGKLVREVGGPDLPGVGFSFGVERLVSVLMDDDLLPDVSSKLDVYMMPMGEDAQRYCLNIANALRMQGLFVDMCFDKAKMGSQFKRAEKKNAKFAMIIGDNEIENGTVIIKNLKTTEQTTVGVDDVINTILTLLDEEHDHECGCGCGCHEHDHDCECGCHEHEHGCGCGCNCGEHGCDCEYCGHDIDAFPCKETGKCPCGNDPKKCECVKNNACKCKMKEGN